MLVLRFFSVGDAGFCQFLLVMLASGFDAVSAGGSVGDVCVCQLWLMMLASGFDAGSAGVFCWGCLFLPAFANDAGFWC